MEKRRDHYIRKFNRILILPLVVLSVVFVIAGYGTVNPQLIGELTGGLLNRSISLYLHTVLAFPVLILLAVHILVQLRFALINLGVKDGVLLNIFVIALGIFITTLFLLMDPRIL
jgi:thiosulfate reductase cytochrome b subunit